MSDLEFAVLVSPPVHWTARAGPLDPGTPPGARGGGPGLLEDQSVVKAGTWPTWS